MARVLCARAHFFGSRRERGPGCEVFAPADDSNVVPARERTEVLARSKHRTKKEIARLVRRLDPLPDAPARIEPLGPAPARSVPVTPTWSQFVESLCPVRELIPGDRPREWAEGTEPPQDSDELSNDVGVPEIVAALPEPDEAPDAAPPGELDESAEIPATARDLPAPARLEPQRYRVQFTAGEEYVKLVEKAQALLSHSAERTPLAELQLRAMRAFVAELERKKRAATTRPATARATQSPAAQSPTVRDPTAQNPDTAAPGAPVESNDNEEAAGARREYTRQRGRHIPAAVRRAVFERDQGRCAYTDDSGQRCRETHHLELHHLKPFATGGEHTLANLALRCSAHNALAAEQDFGRDFIQRRRDGNRHESRRQQSERGGPTVHRRC